MKFMLGYLTDSVFKTWGYDERLCINLIHKELLSSKKAETKLRKWP